MANGTGETQTSDDDFERGASESFGGPESSGVVVDLPEKKKRGRPAGSKNKAQGNSNVGADSLANDSAKFLGLGFVQLVEIGEALVQGSCENKIAKNIPEKLEEFRELAKKLGLTEEDKKLIGGSVEKIALKYDALTKFAPEVVLVIGLSQFAARQALLVRFVNNVTKKPDVKLSSDLNKNPT